MPDVFAVFSRWWKRIAAITVLATVIAVVIVLLLPPKYVSTATALPASSFATDKAAIFNSNIQQLYSSLGTADDLDRVIGTARLDTIYIATATELNLATHYGISKTSNSLYKAALKLKAQSNIGKSEWGELKVKVGDRDGSMAAHMANTLLKKLQELHQNLQNRSNSLVLQKLQQLMPALTSKDSVSPDAIAAAPNAAPEMEQRMRYKTLLSEYELMVATNPPVLLVVEAARPARQPDNTMKLSYVLLSFFTAFVFSVLLAFYTEGKKRP